MLEVQRYNSGSADTEWPDFHLVWSCSILRHFSVPHIVLSKDQLVNLVVLGNICLYFLDLDTEGKH